MTSNIQNILVLVFSRVGEILLTTPTIRALRKSYPEAEITAAVFHPFEDVLSAIDSLIGYLENDQSQVESSG